VSWPGHSAGAPRTTQGRCLAGVLAVVVVAACTGPPSVSPAGPAAASSVPCRRVTHERLPAARGRRRLLSGVRAAARIRTRNGRGDPGRAAYDLAVAGGEDRPPPRRRPSTGRRTPFHRSTWFQIYQSGSWIEALIGWYLDGGPGADAYRAWVRALLLSWLRDVPHPGPRPLTLICSSEAFPGQGWIEDQIPPWPTTRPRAGREPGIMGSGKTCRSWASDAPARPVPSAGRL
jgi:hypothetical protein